MKIEPRIKIYNNSKFNTYFYYLKKDDLDNIIKKHFKKDLNYIEYKIEGEICYNYADYLIWYEKFINSDEALLYKRKLKLKKLKK
jgi:hypothetical protein